MSDPKFLPTTPEGRMWRLVEECGEVLQAVGKLQRFGPDGYHPRDEPRRRTNRESLLEELLDVRRAALEVALDLNVDLRSLEDAEALYERMRSFDASAPSAPVSDETQEGEVRRRAPVAGEVQWSPGDRRRVDDGTVAWCEHAAAHHCYAARCYGSPSQTAEQVAQGGGFGYREMADLLGYPPRSWRPHL